jgi:hypothetical protein
MGRRSREGEEGQQLPLCGVLNSGDEGVSAMVVIDVFMKFWRKLHVG